MAKRLDWRWLILIVLFGIVAIWAVVANLNHADNTANKLSGAITTDNGDQKINWSRYPSYDIELSDSLTITEAGTYHLTGQLDDGMITVDVKNTEARLILDNVKIKNSTGPAIMCSAGDDLVIELVGHNYLEDGVQYDTNYESDVTGALFSRADLSFVGGDGGLTIVANYGDGIVGKDDLKFSGGHYNITSKDDGIRGTDSVYIAGGDFTIVATADGIKSTNEIDVGKGFVLIEDGYFDVTAGAKGIKAFNSVLVNGGDLTVQSYDDAIHSDNYVGITGGKIELSAGDDALHANKELIIDDGEIFVAKSYEGLEAPVVTINGGQISVTASDDGINAGGGVDASTNKNTGRPMADAFAADANCVIVINGGDVYINASGDGIDSNGYVYFNGGKVVVDGPTNNGNGALDSGSGLKMQGGTVVAVGASGMASALSSDSNVCNVSVYFSSVLPAGTKIAIVDSKDQTIIEHTSAKSFSHLAAGTESLVPGETYTILVDGEEYEKFTIATVTTVVGKSNVNQQNMGPQNRTPRN